MKMLRRFIGKISLVTLVLFVFSTVAVEAQHNPQVNIPTQPNQAVDVRIMDSIMPELNRLQGNLMTAQHTLSTLERLSTPIYNKVVPTNMEAMGLAQRVKAILSNAGGLLSTPSMESKMLLHAGETPLNLPFDQQIAYSVEQMGIQASKLSNTADPSTLVGSMKGVLANVSGHLRNIINAIRGKIFAIGQSVGLVSSNKSFVDGRVVDDPGFVKHPQSQQMHFADSFSDKLSHGLTEGVQSAKSSLKSSFSLPNLALTATVAVGTNMAIDMIHGNRPSFGDAVRSVATLEFAGSVAGAALGAAGGQLTSTLVQTFVPGPVGALVGAVIPVMFASSGSQMAGNLISGMRNGSFSVSQAWSQIDKVDLVGSSIGSTIGMMLGAPIPVVGPIIGGIVGGFLGSRVAQMVRGFVTGNRQTFLGRDRGTPVAMPQQPRAVSGPVSVGAIAQGGREIAVSGSRTVDGDVDASASSERLREVERKYYDAYLRYNRLVEAGERQEAREVFEQLQNYSDEYSNLRRHLRSD